MPSQTQFGEWLELLSRKFGCRLPSTAQELTRSASFLQPLPDQESEETRLARWRHLLHIALEMAKITYAQEARVQEPLDPALREHFIQILGERPPVALEFQQAPIDPESSLRRASAIHRELKGGFHSVLFVGDDDATSIALALLEPAYSIWVIDIDERVLESLELASQRLQANLQFQQLDLRTGVPFHLAGRFTAAVLDPPRWYAALMRFLRFANGCVVQDPSARIFWADHPEITPCYPDVLAQFPALGLRLREIVENLHRFPAPPGYLDDLGLPPTSLGIDRPWAEDLIRESQFWTHLHILDRLPT